MPYINDRFRSIRCSRQFYSSFYRMSSNYDCDRNTNNQEDNGYDSTEENNYSLTKENRYGPDEDKRDLGEENNSGASNQTTSACNSGIDVTSAVEALKADVLEIEGYFEEIRRSLSDLDIIQRQRSNSISALFIATPAYKCLDIWEGIRKSFKKLVWRSRELATTTASRAKEFRTDIIPMLNDTQVALSDKKKELAGFLKDLKKTENSALEMAEGFKNIPERILDFQSGYTIMVENNQSSINKEIEKLQNQVETLKSKITQYKDEHVRAWKAIHDGFISEGDAVPIGYDALVAIETLAGPGHREPLVPKYLRGVKTKTIKIKTRTKMSLADNQLRQKKANLDNLKANSEDLQACVKGYLDIAEARTGVTCDKIKAIALVWGAVRTDAQTLHECIAKPVKPVISEQRFRALVSDTLGIVPLYEKLEGILYGYANAIV